MKYEYFLAGDAENAALFHGHWSTFVNAMKSAPRPRIETGLKNSYIMFNDITWTVEFIDFIPYRDGGLEGITRDWRLALYQSEVIDPNDWCHRLVKN